MTTVFGLVSRSKLGFELTDDALVTANWPKECTCGAAVAAHVEWLKRRHAAPPSLPGTKSG